MMRLKRIVTVLSTSRRQLKLSVSPFQSWRVKSTSALSGNMHSVWSNSKSWTKIQELCRKQPHKAWEAHLRIPGKKQQPCLGSEYLTLSKTSFCCLQKGKNALLEHPRPSAFTLKSYRAHVRLLKTKHKVTHGTSSSPVSRNHLENNFLSALLRLRVRYIESETQSYQGWCGIRG